MKTKEINWRDQKSPGKNSFSFFRHSNRSLPIITFKSDTSIIPYKNKPIIFHQEERNPLKITKQFKCIIIKSEFGCGIDIAKAKNDYTRILKFNKSPNGDPSPASFSSPSLQLGDIIFGVGDKIDIGFEEIVKLISECERRVELMIERE